MQDTGHVFKEAYDKVGGKKKVAYLYYRWSHDFVFGSDVLPFFEEVLGPEITGHTIFFIHSTVVEMWFFK